MYNISKIYLLSTILSLFLVACGESNSNKNIQTTNPLSNASKADDNSSSINSENNSSTPTIDDNTTQNSEIKATLEISSMDEYYQEGENVILNSIVKPDDLNIISYQWSEDGNILGTDSTLTKSDLSAGEHTIKLVVQTSSKQLSKIYNLNIIPSNNSNNSGNSSDSYIAKASDFQDKVIDDDKVILDKHNKKMWVSEDTLSKKGCLAVRSEDNYDEAKQFCENLTFAGFSNWHTPSSSELSRFIKDTVDTDTLPGYPNPCPRLLSKDDTFKTVITRYGEKDGKSAGDTESIIFPLGVRCVRDYQDSKPHADAGDDIRVSYHDNFTFDGSRSYDDDGEIVKYEWFHGNDKIHSSSTPFYTREATLPPNDYTVILRVTDDDGNVAEDSVIVHVVP